MSKHKFLEERVEQLETDLAMSAEYFQGALDKQAEENRNLSLMFDNINARCEHLEEHLAMLVDTILDMDMHKK